MFLNYMLPFVTTGQFPIYTLVQKKTPTESGLLHHSSGTLAIMRRWTFPLELIVPLLLACHNPAFLITPSQFNKCNFNSMSREQERGLCIMFIICKN